MTFRVRFGRESDADYQIHLLSQTRMHSLRFLYAFLGFTVHSRLDYLSIPLGHLNQPHP